MNAATVIAPVRKTVRVKAPIAHAFEVFTSGLTRWWPHNHGIGKKPVAKVLMEPRLGGRWYELSEDGSQADVGKVVAAIKKATAEAARPLIARRRRAIDRVVRWREMAMELGRSPLRARLRE